MKLKHIVAEQRPRERLQRLGATHLSNAELLAICLRTGTQHANALDIAQNMLSHFGSLHNVFAATQREFCTLHGVGSVSYITLQACKELVKRQIREHLHQQPIQITQTQHAFDYLQLELSNKAKETFLTMFLDTKNQLIRSERMFYGTINQSAVYPRIIIRRLLELDASNIILAHNHPSGDTKPSNADIAITNTIIKACALVDAKVLDHIIVGSNHCYSMVMHGDVQP